MPGEAHVKWFSKVVNCVSSPLDIAQVVASPLFAALFCAALVVMATVFTVDKQVRRRCKGRPPPALLSGASGAAAASALLRAGVAVYFVCVPWYAQDRPFLLTPELTSGAAWVPAVQLTVAVAVLWRSSVPVAAAGIGVLYACAVWSYGWFHLLDYLYFVGIAAFLVLDALQRDTSAVLRFDLLRLSVGFSLMWVSIEKWVYPEWSYDLLEHQLRQVTMGLDSQFVVMSAGFVEFCLAFLLVFGGLSARVSSLVLLALLVGAIPLAGVLDAIGHAPLLVVLLIFAARPNPMACVGHPRKPWPHRWVLSFAICLLGLMGLYHLAHLAAYPRGRALLSPNLLVALGLVATWCWQAVRRRGHTGGEKLAPPP
ncbi:hypothetical protein AAW51_1890 [Caldimonas brevitalea]|uniref:Uncharacterized protein n=1 Tax=Caldimonas brevitalea TaxID=413882 RepID=A0A0G3BMJ3_9BURK|nr:hypothetical protein AAW51_1890 [Caldimonas brevitalea]